MRWKVEKEPKVNDTRWVKRFAWKPIRIQNEMVWMERYWVKQRYEKYRYDTDLILKWTDIETETMTCTSI